MPAQPITADDWVKEGFTAQQRGSAVDAEAAYEQALRLSPEHPAALQLLGQLARQRGDVRQAELLLHRSLQALPSQPHVHNNLGNLLLSQGRHGEALDSFERAVLLLPSYAEAHYNRARALLRAKRWGEAALAVERAIALSPAATAAQLQLRAQIETEQGRLDQALATLEQALRLAPERAALHHNLGVLLQRKHQHAQALDAHQQALALGLDVADAHYNLGNTLQSLGRSGQALAAYRRALDMQPNHALALLDLARLRWRLNDQPFDAELRALEAAEPGSALAPSLRAHLLWRAERYAEAADAYQLALARTPDVPTLLDGLGRCLVRMGQLIAGLQAHAQAVALAPAEAELHINHSASLLVARQAAAAVEQAQAALQHAPDDQLAWALLGLAWRVLNDPREAWLNRYAEFVAVVDLPAPAGFADMADFNRELAQELASQHHDRAAPIDQTLRGGTQTVGDIFEQPLRCVQALKDRIAAAMQSYVDALPTDTTHPFLRRRAGGWRFSDSWSSRLAPRGFHIPHVHPHGWISAVYYVCVPRVVDDQQARQGWLELGGPDIDVGLEDPVRMHVQPKPGRLVLFPAMFWHGTTPFGDNEPRLTVAFDVLPH
jgi:tetratricopeptide (TPR) repeat protein